MSLAKQITQIAFESTYFTGGNTNLGLGAGTAYQIDTQNYDIDIDAQFYTGSAFDTALSGKLRHNLRAFRPTVRLSFNQNLQAARMRSLFNDIIRALVTNNADSITFYPDASDTANSYGVVLGDDFNYRTSYSNQVGTFSTSMNLQALNEITTIPAYLEGP